MKQKIFNFYQGHKKSIFISLFVFALLVLVGFQFDNLFLKKVNFKGDNVSSVDDLGSANHDSGKCEMGGNGDPLLSCPKSIINKMCGKRTGININFLRIDGHINIQTTCERANLAKDQLIIRIQSLTSVINDNIKNKNTQIKECSVDIWNENMAELRKELSDAKTMLNTINKYINEKCIPDRCSKIKKDIIYYEKKLRTAQSQKNNKDILNFSNILSQLRNDLKKLNCK